MGILKVQKQFSGSLEHHLISDSDVNSVEGKDYMIRKLLTFIFNPFP